MKKLGDLVYYIGFALIYLFSMLPLSILYVFSDLCYVLVYHVAGYRKSVIRRNLLNSFPDKTKRELKDIEKDFFHWFCDYVFETIKLTSMSEQEMRKRLRFEGLDMVRKAAGEGRSSSVYLGHYCNWEWVSSLGIHLPEYVCGQIYHELENKYVNRYFLKIRGRFKAQSVVMEETLQTIREWHKEGKISVVGYISDQVPGFSSMHYWPTFLNQQTPTYTGTERIAKIFDTAVFYMDIIRPRRGYYVVRLIKMSDGAKSEPLFSLTERYYRLLEQSIQRNPPYWLWSHNRWKRKWEDFVEYFPDPNERKRILSKL